MTEPRTPLVDAVRLAIPLGIGLIIGVLAAMGITGDALQRLIRNSPDTIAAALTIAVLGVGIPATVATVVKLERSDHWKGTSRWRYASMAGAVGGSLALVLASILVVRAGTDGIHERENPSLAVDVTSDGTSLTADIDAAAPTLSSDEKMLLRVVALTRPIDADRQQEVCQSPSRAGEDFDLLVWEETGPDRTGYAKHSVKVTVPPTAAGVCVYAGLFDRNAKSPDDDRTTWAIVDETSFPPMAALPAADKGGAADK